MFAKRFTNAKKTLSIVLAILVFLSGLSIVTVSATSFFQDKSGNYHEYACEEEKNSEATRDEAAKSSSKFEVLFSETFGARWPAYSTYTNQVTKTSGFVGPNLIMSYKRMRVKGTNDNAFTVWCISPHLAIDANGNYYQIGSKNGKGDATYWNKFKTATGVGGKKIYDVCSKLLALGKYKGANGNNEYYFAVQAIMWEYIMGFRNTNTHKPVSGYSKVIVASNTSNNNKLSNAYSYLIKQMKTDLTAMPKGFKYSTLSKAKSATASTGLKQSQIYKKKTGTKKITFNIAGASNYNLKYSIVNASGSNVSTIKWKRNNNKFTITTTRKNIFEKKYFLKVKKIIPVTGSSGNNVYCTSTGYSQTTLQNLSYTVPTVIRYVPFIFRYKNIPSTPTGGLKIQKNITPSIDNSHFEADYSGWYFYAISEGSSKQSSMSKMLVTDEDGETETFSGIEMGVKVNIYEYGRLITSNDDENDFEHIRTHNGKKYGIPKDVKPSKLSDKITITEKDKTVTVEWENVVPVTMKVKIIKEVDDEQPVQGYYFLAYDSSSVSANQKKLLNNPIIVGPTDKNGEIEFTLDTVARRTLAIIELGLLKSGVTNFNRKLTAEEFKTGVYRDNFEIPSRYNKVTGYYNVTGNDDGVPYTITNDEATELYKEIVVTNTTSGYISLTKTDSVSKEAVKGAVYGLFTYLQSDDSQKDKSPAEDGKKHSNSTNEKPISLKNVVIENSADKDNDGQKYNSIENLVCTFTTDENGNSISPSVPTGRYYVQELSCPDNYVLDPNKNEVILKAGHNTLGNPQQVDVSDKPSNVVINKLESSSHDTNGNQLQDAVLQIFEKPESGSIDYSTANAVYEFTTTDKSEKLLGVLDVGKTYILHEKKAPDGYCKANDKEFTVSEDGSEDIVTMYDSLTNIEILKIDSKTQKPVKGATLALRQKNNNKIIQWETTEEPRKFEGELIIGETYILSEIKTPHGYATAKPIEFTVESTNEVVTITMSDDPIVVSISKKDITNDKELPGAKLEITDTDKNVIIPEWTSTDEPHIITYGFQAGKEYILTERIPADGYATANDVHFTVSDTGKVQSVVMKDDTIKVSVSKQDITNSEEIEGAHLKITDKETGKVIDQWVSQKETHYIEGKMIVGKSYILTETIPADGYTTANSIEFIIKDTGDIQSLVMKDDITKVSISKTDITGEKEVEGAQLEVADKKTKKVIDSWTSEKQPHKINGKLIAKRTYILTEKIPADGYATANSIEFTVKDSGEVQQVVMKDDTVKVNINKIASDTNKALKGATLKLQDENFADVETFKTTDKPYRIKAKLKVGQYYYLDETEAPDGYDRIDGIKFKVVDTGKVQTIKIVDKKSAVSSPESPMPHTGGEVFSALGLAFGITLMLGGTFIFLSTRRPKRKE